MLSVTVFAAAPASAAPCVLYDEDHGSVGTTQTGHSVGVCVQPVQLHCGYVAEGVVWTVWHAPGFPSGVNNPCYSPI